MDFPKQKMRFSSTHGTGRSEDGYKLREELTCRIAAGSASPGRILEALGYVEPDVQPARAATAGSL